MTVEELVESGIIELYCLGLASKEEKLLVDQLGATDPLISHEISAVSNALAMYAVNFSRKNPSESLRNKILSSFEFDRGDSGQSNFPPKLTQQSSTTEWLEYLEINQLIPVEMNDDLLVTELPGTEDYYTYLVFGKPGAAVSEEGHNGHDEYLLICEGTCEMTIGGKKFSYKKGDYLTIVPGTSHSALITGTGTMIAIGQRRAA